MKKNIIGISILVVITLLGLYFFKYPDLFINSYQKCIDAGYKVEEGYPERCITKNGKLFTNPITTYDSKIETRLYFSISEDNPEMTKPVIRMTNRKDLPQFTMEELIKGPTEDEIKNLKIFSSLKLEGESNCNNDFTLSIENKAATIKLCKSIENSGLIPDARIKETITQTLLQFETIQKVIVLDKNDNCVADLSGKNLCLVD